MTISLRGMLEERLKSDVLSRDMQWHSCKDCHAFRQKRMGLKGKHYKDDNMAPAAEEDDQAATPSAAALQSEEDCF